MIELEIVKNEIAHSDCEECGSKEKNLINTIVGNPVTEVFLCKKHFNELKLKINEFKINDCYTRKFEK